MKATKNRLLWVIKVNALKKSAERSKSRMLVISWMREVINLQKEYQANNAEKNMDLDNPDYQYLQSIISRSVPNLNDPEIGTRLTSILNKNSKDDSFISYIKQAVAVYRDAFLSMSKQFTWERT